VLPCKVRPQRLPETRGSAARLKEENAMSVARVTEITSSSKQSFEDAIKQGIDRACKTLKNVQGAWVQEQKITIKNNAISTYRVNMKVTFVLDD
jgi:flavin-binding protein dodecin